LLALRGRGRQALLDQLQADIAHPGSDTPFNVRLLDTAPGATDLPAIDRLLEAPRPACATTLDEHERDGVWKLTLRLPLELLCFDGHFPQAPVLPGVMQIAWALAMAAPRLGTSTQCRDMKGLKFQRLLHPGDRVELSLHVDQDATATRDDVLHFSYRLGGAHCSSGRLFTGHAHA
jgi:3-hydroxymyristoyl/3-hydroxydecanoyl-(acyl carrier protein) dehydratase